MAYVGSVYTNLMPTFPCDDQRTYTTRLIKDKTSPFQVN